MIFRALRERLRSQGDNVPDVTDINRQAPADTGAQSPPAPAYLLEQVHAALAAGEKEGARALLEHIVVKHNGVAEAHLLLGILAHERGDHEDARDSYTLAECFGREWWPVHFQFGLLELDQGRAREAVAPLSRALELGARDARVHNALGAAYTQTEQLEQAVEQYRAAVALDPELPEAQSNLGYLLFRDLEDYEAGTEHIEKALRLAPENVAVLCNWNMVLQHRGKFDEALALTERLIERDANLSEARVTRALLQLMRGEFGEGWRDYEYRKLLPRNHWPDAPVVAEWDGSELAKKTVFVYSEQGLGDDIMFASCLPDLARRAGTCIVECHPKLQPIFQRSFPDAVVIEKDSWKTSDVFARHPPDFKVASGSLPLYFRRQRQDFPQHRGYLHAEPARIACWRSRLAALPGRVKVGISWRGGAPSTRRALRSIPLAEWAAVFAVGDVDFVSLQYSDCTGEIARAKALFGVTIHQWPEAVEDYEETAALTAAVDLVISVQTAIVHLAGALGQRACALISAVPEWRYGTTGKDMPWYPSVKLFRQKALGDWAPTVNAVRDEVENELDKRGGRGC